MPTYRGGAPPGRRKKRMRESLQVYCPKVNCRSNPNVDGSSALSLSLVTILLRASIADWQMYSSGWPRVSRKALMACTLSPSVI